MYTYVHTSALTFIAGASSPLWGAVAVVWLDTRPPIVACRGAHSWGGTTRAAYTLA